MKTNHYVCNAGHTLKMFENTGTVRRFVCRECNEYYEEVQKKGITYFQKIKPLKSLNIKWPFVEDDDGR